MTTPTTENSLKNGKNRLIGFCGRKGSGKDTAAEPLLEAGWAKVSLAMPLKDICSKCFGIHPEFFENRALKDSEFEHKFQFNEKDVEQLLQEFTICSPHIVQKVTSMMVGKRMHTPRELLQFIGTDVVRNVINRYEWVNRCKDKIVSWFERGENVVITDVRFADEADMLRDLGGFLIEIDRDGNESDTHESENLDFEVHVMIDNSGTIEEFHERLDMVLKEIDNGAE